ncbi:19904_t:CDS:1, partial [Racocetra persica]
LISMINMYTLAAPTPQYWIDYNKRQYSLVEKRQCILTNVNMVL